MSRPLPRRLAVLGVALGFLVLVGAGLAFAASPRAVTASSAAAVGGAGATGDQSATAALPAPDPTPATDPSTTTAPPPAAAAATTTTRPRAATSTVPRASAAPAASASPAAAPATQTTTAAPKLAPGQRLDPTSAQVQAAITQLHQRIPLFAPTEAQLRTFADAVCSSFDQGQTQAQVQSTVQDAVSHIQGASLSAADAQFAVQIVVQLRCPGYLP